jgi:hypothetical protein
VAGGEGANVGVGAGTGVCVATGSGVAVAGDAGVSTVGGLGSGGMVSKAVGNGEGRSGTTEAGGKEALRQATNKPVSRKKKARRIDLCNLE